MKEQNSFRQLVFKQHHTQMKLNRFTLRFEGEYAAFEPLFLAHYFNASLVYVRIALTLGIFLYSGFGMLDYYMAPDSHQTLWFIRFVIFDPVVLMIILMSFTKYFTKLMQPLLSLSIIVAGVGIIFMIAHLPRNVGYSYYAGLIIVFMMGYTVIKARFLWASLAGWIIVAAYEILALSDPEFPTDIFISNNFFLVCANFVGMFAGYVTEYYLRFEFFLQHLLETERQKVNLANEELEERVKERTFELQQANEFLKKEMHDRKRAEQERIKAEKRLLQQKKMESIGMMASGVAHDLNNILSGVVSYPELLLAQLPTNSSLREHLEIIQKSGKRAADVVADLLTVAQGVANVREVISVNRLVELYLKSVEFKRLISQFPEIRIITKLSKKLYNCECSPVHISKMIMNLVTNAIEAISDDGIVTILTENQKIDTEQAKKLNINAGYFAILKIRDTGVGIAKKDLDQIFEPFYTKKVLGRKGTGLGLSVVWNTVKEHNGIVLVESDANGTEFQVFLPASPEKEVKVDSTDSIDAYKGSGKILIVDDENQQRDISKRVLSMLGYAVDAVENGEEAVKYVEKNAVDLVVLDMLMEPGINGLQTYERMMKINPRQKAIIVSGMAENYKVKRAMQLGVGKFVRKPYLVGELARAVHEVINSEARTN